MRFLKKLNRLHFEWFGCLIISSFIILWSFNAPWLNSLNSWWYDKILLSPGPGIPSESGLLLPLIKTYAATKSILGVCLGQQAIAEAFGGSLTNLSKVYHGIATPIELIGESNLFEGLPTTFQVGRYHSWVVNEQDLPAELKITSKDADGYIMSLEHTSYDVKGVQYHPESVLTPDGAKIIGNWLKN